MKIDPLLLKKYWNESCSEQEQKLVESWLDSGEAEIEDTQHLHLNDEDRDELWKRISSENEFKTPILANRKKSTNTLPIRWAVSAAVIFIVGLFSVFAYLNADKLFADNQTATYKDFYVPKGKKMRIVLPDQTVVNLNSSSTLRYSESSNPGERRVWLKGEGYFEVAHDSLHPFIIQTISTQTRVLGTKFNLKQYADDSAATVSVTEGQVRFSNLSKTASVNLKVNEQGTFNNNNIIKKTIPTAQFSSWMHNKLRFSDINLAEAAILIERWYNVKVEFEQAELRKKMIRASFDNLDIKSLIREMNYLMNINASFEDGIVKFKN